MKNILRLVSQALYMLTATGRKLLLLGVFELLVQERGLCEWWAWVDLNHRPRPYQGRALAT